MRACLRVWCVRVCGSDKKLNDISSDVIMPIFLFCLETYSSQYKIFKVSFKLFYEIGPTYVVLL